MKSMEVVSAVFNETTGFIEVAKRIVNDDDTIEYAGQSFHPETVEWWAAVYDTDDIDELIDMILHEPYVENIEPMKMSAEEARLSHKEKIATLKATQKKVSRVSTVTLASSGLPEKFIAAASKEPLQTIKDACLFDPKVVAVKKAHIEEIRAKNLVSNQRPVQEDRSEALKSKLSRGERVTPPQRPTASKSVLPTIVLEGKRKVTNK